MFGFKWNVDRSHPLWAPLSPRQRGVMLGISLLLIPTIALAAWLLVFLTATASITAGAMNAVTLTAVMMEAPSPASCTVAWTGGTTTAALSWPDAQPGELCRLHIVLSGGAGTFYRAAEVHDAGLLVDLLDPGGPGVYCGFALDGTQVDDYVDFSLDPALSSPGGGPYTSVVTFENHAVAPTCP